MTQKQQPKRLSASFRAALAASIPVLAGYLFLGSAYGVLMQKLGYGVGWTALMSFMVYGGTIQFIATSLLALGFQPLNAFVVSAVVNARHLFYGFSLLERYAGLGWKKPFLIFWLTDETFSLVCSGDTPEGADEGWYLWFLSGLDHLYWIAGGVLGNVLVSLFNFNAKGIDFVMTSLFTVIVINQWQGTKNHFPALVGLAASAVCLFVLGPDYFIIPAMLCIVAALMLRRKRMMRTEPEEELAEELAEEKAAAGEACP